MKGRAGTSMGGAKRIHQYSTRVSSAQFKYIRDLIKQRPAVARMVRGEQTPPERVRKLIDILVALMAHRRFATRIDASVAIDMLKAIPRDWDGQATPWPWEETAA